MTANKNRTKGHNLERMVARFFREELGYLFCKTSRQASRTLDDCGIDLYGIPFNIQCKSGYDKQPPKFKDIYNYIKDKLKTNVSPDDVVHNLPIILIHKNSSRKPEGFTVTMTYEDFKQIMLSSNVSNKQ